MRRIGRHHGKHDLLSGAWRGEPSGGPVPVVQTFLGNPRSYADPGLTLRDAEDLRDVTVYSHAAYVINVASDDAVICARSRRRMWNDLRAAATFGCAGLVVHPGSCADPMLGIARWRDFFEEYGPPPVPVLFENSAGRGIAQTPAQLERLWARMPQWMHDADHVALCVDTAHAWSAGVEPVDFLRQVDAPVSLLHLNGSSADKGGGWDRHAAPASDADRIGLTQLAYCVWQARGADVVMETWDPPKRPRPGLVFVDSATPSRMGSVAAVTAALDDVVSREGR